MAIVAIVTDGQTPGVLLLVLTIEAPRVIAAAVALPPAVNGPPPPPPPEAPKAEPAPRSIPPWLEPVPWDLRLLRGDRSGGPQPWI